MTTSGSANAAWSALAFLERQFRRVARRGWLACLVTAGAVLILRAAVHPVLGIPEPKIQDEFSYILGGETFAAGRLTNPPHPMWQHLETVHVNQQPTYASKYPPAQSLFLALGIRAFGHPWFGVWLSVAVMCACVCWMLRQWLPPPYALLGGLLAAVQFGVWHYWMNTYWGGAVAAAGGCLVLGAVPALARRPRVRAVAALAVGLVLLANSRPYEGFVLAVAATGAVLLWRWRLRAPIRALVSPRLIAAFLVVMLPAVAWMGYYNLRVTGSPLTMPYALHQRQYAAAPLFYLQPDLAVQPTYRHEEIRKLWAWDREVYLFAKANPLRVVRLFVMRVLPQFVPAASLLPIAIAFWIMPATRYRYAFGIAGVFVAALLLERYLLAHYAAPGMGLVVLAIVLGLRQIRLTRFQRHPMGLLIALTLMCLILAEHIAPAVASAVSTRGGRIQPGTFAAARRDILDQIGRQGGRHLVIVRYRSDHDFHQEWVYNRADIDGSPIVWARDMGAAKNRELLEYFRDRTVHLLEPDETPTRLRAYRYAPDRP
jgi:hypothetical protein